MLMPLPGRILYHAIIATPTVTHNLVLGRYETLICFQRCQSVSLTYVRPPIFLWQCQYPNNRSTMVECKLTLHKCRFSMSKFFTDKSKIFVIINIVTYLLFCKKTYFCVALRIRLSRSLYSASFLAVTCEKEFSPSIIILHVHNCLM